MMILIFLLFIVMLFFILSLCNAAALADRHMEIAFARWLREHPDEAQQYANEEII